MPRPRFERLDQQKRQKIIETAAREFAAHGFEGASLNHILAEAGISKGAAYYYFDGKADLYAAVLRHYWDHVLQHVDLDIAGLDRESFWTKVEELYQQGIAHAFEDPWIMPLAKAVWKWSAVLEGQAGVPETLLDIRDKTFALLARGQQVGAVRKDVPIELLFAIVVAADEALDSWFLRHAAELDRAEAEVLWRRVLGMVRSMVTPPEGGDEGPAGRP
jgi:AcrR family transcriptional regulator